MGLYVLFIELRISEGGKRSKPAYTYNEANRHSLIFQQGAGNCSLFA